MTLKVTVTKRSRGEERGPFAGFLIKYDCYKMVRVTVERDENCLMAAFWTG
jgi:hypothetical protein